jgi:hypothetical protein
MTKAKQIARLKTQTEPYNLVLESCLGIEIWNLLFRG